MLMARGRVGDELRDLQEPAAGGMAICLCQLGAMLVGLAVVAVIVYGVLTEVFGL
jgi:hypothetical protein